MGQEMQAAQNVATGYVILRPIGEGGMGRVFLARRTSLGKLVAIKFLRATSQADPAEQAARFRREAEIMARANHPNVVSVYDFGDAGGQTYLVMEYVEEGDLRRIMPPGRPMPADRVKALIGPIARALAHLHSLGILHRDLKPENILMAHGSVPKVTDFGIAVRDDADASLTRSGEWRGTLGYVAPEQQYRLRVDERADQYSLAAVAYELLTGQRPLGRFRPPSELNPTLRPDVDAVILKALQEDPDDRYPAILAFGDALESALGRPGGDRRSRPVRAALAAGLLLAAVAAVVGFSKARGPKLGPPGPVAVAPGPLATGLDLRFVLVPAGEFLMGTSDNDPAASPDEFPRHRVTISRPFHLSSREVTVRQFRAFVDDTNYITDAEKDGKGGYIYDFIGRVLVQDPAFTWRRSGYAGPSSDDDPVVQVSWNDAVAFCNWLSEREGRLYRLPTEAQWEYACRAKTTTRWSSGDDPDGLAPSGWTFENSDGRPHAVGLKGPNGFGLHDMHGNVWEWCLDRFGPYRGEDAIDPAGPEVGPERILRGGAWDWERTDRTRSASRLDSRPDYRYFSYGFRVCLPTN